jgi:hypothetical protein
MTHYYMPRNVTDDPREMPELRRAMLDLAALDGPWGQAEQVRSLQDIVGTFKGKGNSVDLRAVKGPKGYDESELQEAFAAAVDRGENAMNWYRQALRDAQLMHVTTPMCEVLFASEESVPHDVVLHEEMVPTMSGLCVFQQPFTGVDSGDEREEVRVDAILWHPVLLPPRDEFITGTSGVLRGIAMAAFRWLDSSTQDDIVAEDAPSTDRMWLPLGRADWLFGDTIGQPPHDGIDPDSKAHASMCEDRRLHAALWSLIQQKRMVERVPVQPRRPSRRRLDRAGDTTSRTVEVIYLRRPEYRPRNDDGSVGRKIGVRFAVKGHWRNQPYGPGREKRRLILIPPHLKGPEDAPFHHAEKVWEVSQ